MSIDVEKAIAFYHKWKEYQRAYSRDYYQRNRERIKERQKQYIRRRLQIAREALRERQAAQEQQAQQ